MDKRERARQASESPVVHPLLTAAADLLLGATCPACRLPAWGLCQECRNRLTQQEPARYTVDGLPIVAACLYRPVLEHAIPRYKDDGALHLEALLGRLLAGAVTAHDLTLRPVLVPVPSLKRAVRARGFDHGRRLASRAARCSGLRMCALLRRAAEGADQAGLGRQARRRNLEGSMRARPSEVPVLLVDDIVTTGASLMEARRALTGVGVPVLGAAVIARVDNFAPAATKS